MKSEKWASAVVTLVITASALLSWASLTGGHDWGGDFAQYILQGRSLVERNVGPTLEDIRFTMDFSSQSMGPYAYPWGYPIILSGVYLVAGLDPTAFKLPGVVCFLLFLACLFPLFRHGLSPWQRVVLVALFALNPDLIGFLDHILSDVPFLLLSTLSILLIDRIVIQGRGLLSMPVDRIVLGAVLFAAYFVRGNGLLLLPVLLVAEVVVAGRRIVPGSLVPYAVFGVLALAAAIWFPQDASNLTSDWTTSVSLEMLYRNAVYYFFLPSLAMGGGWPGIVVYVASLPFAIVAAIRGHRREAHLIVYVALTIGMYLLLPFASQGPRYLYPLLPVLFYLVLSGMAGLPRRTARTAAFMALCLLLALFSFSSARAAILNLGNGRMIEGPFDPISRAMFDHVSRSTGEDSVIIFFKPRVMTLMTWRRAIMVWRDEQLGRGDYLVYDRRFNLEQVSDRTVGELLAAGALQPRFENDRFIVFRIEKARLTGTGPAGRGVERTAIAPRV